jgi:hypothetical protein
MIILAIYGDNLQVNLPKNFLIKGVYDRENTIITFNIINP